MAAGKKYEALDIVDYVHAPARCTRPLLTNYKTRGTPSEPLDQLKSAVNLTQTLWLQRLDRTQSRRKPELAASLIPTQGRVGLNT